MFADDFYEFNNYGFYFYIEPLVLFPLFLVGDTELNYLAFIDWVANFWFEVVR